MRHRQIGRAPGGVHRPPRAAAKPSRATTARRVRWAPGARREARHRNAAEVAAGTAHGRLTAAAHESRRNGRHT